MEDLTCVLNDTKVHDVHKQQNYNSCLQKEENCLNKEKNWNVKLEQTIPSVFGGLIRSLEA
jgi:hypothetical protein